MDGFPVYVLRWTRLLPGVWYTSRKSPAAIEKSEVGGRLLGSTSGKVIGWVWSAVSLLLVHWCIHGYSVNELISVHLVWKQYVDLYAMVWEQDFCFKGNLYCQIYMDRYGHFNKTSFLFKTYVYELLLL